MTDMISGRRNWVIPAAIKYVDQICSELSVWLLECDLGEHSFPVQLLAREALNNAILHGCEQQESLLVQFAIQVSLTEIVLEVEDEGPGFDWQSRLYQSQPAEVHRTSGRGMWIYKLFASQIEFNPKGNQVRLVRRFGQTNAPFTDNDPPAETWQM